MYAGEDINLSSQLKQAFLTEVNAYHCLTNQTQCLALQSVYFMYATRFDSCSYKLLKMQHYSRSKPFILLNQSITAFFINQGQILNHYHLAILSISRFKSTQKHTARVIITVHIKKVQKQLTPRNQIGPCYSNGLKIMALMVLRVWIVTPPLSTLLMTPSCCSDTKDPTFLHIFFT